MFFKDGAQADRHFSPFNGLEVKLAQKWADLMETHVAIGGDLKDIAMNALDKADDQKICTIVPELFEGMIDYLTQYWEYGPQLLVWSESLTRQD